MTGKPGKYSSGVTLVELMVVVVVIAVLMSIAVPSYRQYSVRANRAEAQWVLLKVAAAQEQFYLQNNTYATNAQLLLGPPNGLGLGSAVTESQTYQVSIDAANALGFTASAQAIGGQANDDADCPLFGVNERGVRYGGPGPVNDMGSNDPQCWGR